MSIKNNPYNYPFTPEQLKEFEHEMKQAGDFDSLMTEKQALKRSYGNSVICSHDIENYKEQFLTGVYESLRSEYDTEVPYVFWCRMYSALRHARTRII